ncbi:MAG: hypothetical protein AB7F96_20635 [Beijerinckiaceae bacterium]
MTLLAIDNGPDGRTAAERAMPRRDYLLEPASRPAHPRKVKGGAFDKSNGDMTKRGWKTRFFRKLASAPALFVFATIVAPGLLLGARYKIVEAAPATARAYAAIGLPVNLDGLDLRNISSELNEEDSAKFLIVRGEIVNLRDKPGVLPNLQLALRGSGGQQLYSWQAPSPQKRIGKHASIRFMARLDSPPEGAQDVSVRFAPRTN